LSHSPHPGLPVNGRISSFPNTVFYIEKQKRQRVPNNENILKIMFTVSYFSEVIDKPSLINRYNGRFELLVPKDLNSKKTPEKYQEDVHRIKKFYFGDDIISKQNLERFASVSFY
jgi:hypothetical protein